MDDLLFPLEEVSVDIDVKIQRIPEKEFEALNEDLRHYAAGDEIEEIQYPPPETFVTEADF